MAKITINGLAHEVAMGTTVAAAILNSGATAFRASVNGEPRAPICGMGICYECRVTIDGVAHQRSCMFLCRDGMVIETNG